MPRYAGRRDATHAEIRDALRALGWSVYDSGGVGGSFPDLVVGAAGFTFLVECKSGAGKLSAGQNQFIEHWRGGPVVVARSAPDAIAAISARIKANGL